MAGEVALMACGWVPGAGAGCDAVDLGRSAMDKEAVGVTLEAAGFIRLAGDAAKLPKQLDNIPDRTRDKKEQLQMVKPPTREDLRVGGLSPWTLIGGQAAGIGDPAMRKSRDPAIRRRR
ncbi:hypothetical protein AB0N16_18445 [Streptomyces sp. NPDC051105]|uniref:hypothetical protein n=1 Tax=Streptomyces sp. NPDC051105 TaxID=3154843 RepID=UPI00341E1F79